MKSAEGRPGPQHSNGRTVSSPELYNAVGVRRLMVRGLRPTVGGLRPPARALLRTRILRYYARYGRDLPWRRTRDPYAVLVSEVMLQQTQVSRVVPAYRAFLARFPTLRALARASLGDVIRAWSGLGYNRRARELHRSAPLPPRSLPPQVAELDAPPGVRPYTARAAPRVAHRG